MSFHGHHHFDWLHMLPPIIARSVIGIFLAAVIVLEGGNFINGATILQVVLIVVASIVGIAVMRRDVKVLQGQMRDAAKWRESHDTIHNDNTKLMGELGALARGMERRISDVDEWCRVHDEIHLRGSETMGRLTALLEVSEKRLSRLEYHEDAARAAHNRRESDRRK